MTTARPGPVDGRVSFWLAQTGVPPRRPPLEGPAEADVCVVGAGLTGLWTAYYLKRADPSLDVLVLEREHAGFGASGRSGGWVTSSLAGSARRYAASAGRGAVLALQAEMEATVDEVGAVLAAEGIDAGYVKGGNLDVARTPAQLVRLRAAAAEGREWGLTGTELLDAGATAARLRVDGALGSAWYPGCARVHPARLVLGLARVVEGMGVRIAESTPVTALEPHRARTPRGDVRARAVLRATEGFTAGLPGQRRTWLPMNSSMVVTDPLPPRVWDVLGWAGRECLGDLAHAYVYAQRTADDRIALGGRGVPYRYGSRTDDAGRTRPGTVRALSAALGGAFPVLREALPDGAGGVRVAHAWSGVLAVPRDWCSSAGYDPRTGLGWAGGYTGHGVATANLAGRTLRDLVLGRDTPLTRLPWVGRTSRRWEPEPLRWIAVRALYAAYRRADAAEAARRSPRTSPLAALADVVSGRR